MSTTLAVPYAKRPVKRTGDDGVDADKMLRELGSIESSLKIPVAATGGYFTLTDPQWGGDNTGARDNGTAVRRILTMIANGLTPIRAIYFPGGDYRFSRNFTLTGGDHDNVTLFGDGPSTRLFLSDIPDETSVESGWMCILDGTTAAPLRGVRVTGLRFDGNKASTDWADSSNGVVAYTDAVLENCVVESCWAHDFLTNGCVAYTGGIRFTNLESYDNDSHGLAVSVDNTFTGVCEVYQLRAHGNAGGLDVGRGCRSFVRGVEAYENTEQGVKYSIGTVFLDIDGVHTYGNGVAGVSGPGFTDTDTTGDGTIIIGTIVSHDNAGPGIRLTAGNRVTFQSLVSYDNDGYVASAVADYDILLGSTTLLDYFDGGDIYVANAPKNGVYIDGSTMKSYHLGTVRAVRCGDAGVVDNTTGPVYGTFDALTLIENNQNATAGSAGAVVQLESNDSFFHIGSLVCRDDQGSPTQTVGLLASLQCRVKVGHADFDAAIATPYYVDAAQTGTVILHQNAWTDLRATSSTTTATLADGTILVDATGGARSVNLPPAATSAWKVYTVKKVDASVNAVTVDPSGAETIDGAGTYPLALQYQSVTFQSDGTTWWVL